MRRPDVLRPQDDDGRVVADMDMLSCRGDEREPAGQARAQLPPMSRREMRSILISATLAGLTVAAVLSLAVVGLVLFCQFVWFR